MFQLIVAINDIKLCLIYLCENQSNPVLDYQSFEQSFPKFPPKKSVYIMKGEQTMLSCYGKGHGDE